MADQAEAGVARARDYLDAFASGDRARLAEHLDENIVWRVGGYHRHSGTYRGHDELFGYLDSVAEETGGTITLEPEAVLSSGPYTTMYLHVRAERDGKTMDVTMAEALKAGDDGRYTEYWALADDQPAVDAFWGE